MNLDVVIVKSAMEARGAATDNNLVLFPRMTNTGCFGRVSSATMHAIVQKEIDLSPLRIWALSLNTLISNLDLQETIGVLQRIFEVIVKDQR